MSASEKWPIGKKGVPTYAMENKIHSTESGSAPTIPITFAPRKKPTPLASGCPNAQPAQVPSKTPFAPPHNPDTRLPESPSLSPKTPAALKAPSNTMASYSKHTTPSHPFPQPTPPSPDSGECSPESPDRHSDAARAYLPVRGDRLAHALCDWLGGIRI